MMITAMSPRARLRVLDLSDDVSFWPGESEPSTDLLEGVLVGRNARQDVTEGQQFSRAADLRATHFLYMEIPENGGTGLDMGQHVQVEQKFQRGAWSILPEGHYEKYEVTSIKHHPSGGLAKVGLSRL